MTSQKEYSHFIHHLCRLKHLNGQLVMGGHNLRSEIRRRGIGQNLIRPLLSQSGDRHANAGDTGPCFEQNGRGIGVGRRIKATKFTTGGLR